MRQAAPQPGVIGPCYIIAYDPEEGFEAEERTVRLMGQRECQIAEMGLVRGIGWCCGLQAMARAAAVGWS